MKLTIDVKDAEIVRKGLQNLAAEIPKIGRQQLRTAANRIVRRMQAYPPEPAGQSVSENHPVLGTIYRQAKGRYRRTGKLGRSWVITQTSSGYQISNNAAQRGRVYTPYVVGDARGGSQAWMHESRWPLFRDVVEEEFDKLPAEIGKHIMLAARRKGF